MINNKEISLDFNCESKASRSRTCGFMQERGDLQNLTLKNDVGIRVINKLYTHKFKKYIYHCWIQKSFCKSYKVITLKKGRYQLIHTNHTLQFVPTTCTNTFDVNPQWDELSYLHALIISFTKLEFYALETYHNLTNFFYSWFLFKKEKGTPLMGL